MSIVLGANQYGKAENRVVRIYRDTDRHEIRDLNVSTSLRGDFDGAHITGDQTKVLPTDTQKNTSFAYAKEHGITSPEDYAIALGTHFLEAAPPATGAQIRVEEYAWDRIAVDGEGHDHSFVRRGTETRTRVVTVEGRGDEQQVWVVSGLQDLTVLKSTGSEFKGFLKDKYTTLQETDDRIMATSLTARWRYEGTAARRTDWDKAYEDIKRIMMAGVRHDVQPGAPGDALRDGQATCWRPTPRWRRSSSRRPTSTTSWSTSSPFGLENNGEVFIAADRPYGLIEAAVSRDDSSDAGLAWQAVPGFV